MTTAAPPPNPLLAPASIPWDEHQAWEKDWWGDCVNTFSEENKQISYAHRMGLQLVDQGDGRWPVYDLGGRRIMDIGGGPVSLLLKCINRGPCLVVDPCRYPQWVKIRYAEAGIHTMTQPGEAMEPGLIGDGQFDEVWIYNVLQHTQDPAAIAANARQVAPVVRVFEWIDTPPAMGHPHTLTAAKLAAWFQTPGQVEQMNENGCVGPAWFGVATADVPAPTAAEAPGLPTLSERIASIIDGVPTEPDYGGGTKIVDGAAEDAAARILAMVQAEQ